MSQAKRPASEDPSLALAEDACWSGFEMAVLGGGLLPEVQDLLARAGACRHNVPLAEALLDEAEALAKDHPAVLIARYRLHFYGHHLEKARDTALRAMNLARRALKREVVGQVDISPALSDEQLRFDAAVRFYLFSLKGLAYLCLRLGDLDEALLALMALKRLDPLDRLGAAVLFDVLARRGQEDDEYVDDLGVSVLADDKASGSVS